MLLAPGVRIGPYEIVGPLGAGGMGEVWRARDPRLGREVAIKVLPASAVTDPHRLHRFEQEARAAGALHHPNVLAVYDVGSHESMPYIVSELLEGDTLRVQIRAGGLTPRKAVEYAIQIARGLAAAHERGIVHRDLKPENVFVGRDGAVKILDFGLAKLCDGPSGGPEDDTATQMTRPGTIVGTVAYMSPEQVRGLPLDPRSDIFSLGVVLYEMLARQRPFGGETPAEVQTAILRQEPPELPAIDVRLSTALDRVVRRCLEKRPGDRFDTARDVALSLDAVGVGSDAASTAAAAGAPLRSLRRPWPWLLLAAGLAVVAAGGFLAGRRTVEVEPPSFEQVTLRRGSVVWARFAGDGETIVYGAAWEGRPPEVYLTRRGSTDSRPLGFSPAILLALSSTGEMALSLEPRFIYSNFQPGVLAQAPLTGGAARRLVPHVNAADWSPDGGRLALARSGDFEGTRIEFPQGKVVYETREASIGSLRVSPDGTRVAFTEHGGRETRVMLLDRDGRARTLSGGWDTRFPGLAWSPSGTELYFSLARPPSMPDLYAVDLQGRQRRLLRLPGGLRLQDVARDGTFLLSHMRLALRLMVARSSGPDTDLSWFDRSFVNDISPDGKQILFTEYGGDQSVLYLRPVDGSAAVRLGTALHGALSPDASRVAAFVGDRLVLLQTREGDTVELPRGTVKEYVATTWMPDGRHLLISGRDAEGDRVFLQDAQGGPPRPVTPTGFTLPQPLPDGRHFVTLGDHIVTHSLDGSPPLTGPAVHASRSLVRCAADGRSAFAYSEGDLPGHVYRIDLATGKEEVERTLLPVDPAGVWRVHPVVVTPDGRTCAYTASQTFSDLYLYKGLR